MSTEKTYRPINCGLYDYLEIACLYHYDLDIKLRDGTLLKCAAQTTLIKEGAEFLVVQLHNASAQGRTPASGSAIASANTPTSTPTDPPKHTSSQHPIQTEIRLDTLAQITVTSTNRQFDTINFETGV